MSPDHDVEPVTIELFPDYVDRTLWLGDPVEYEKSGLTPGLIQDLQDWEQSYYDSIDMDNNHEWKSPGLASAFTAQGNVLAQRVTDEIGPGFEVEFSSYEQGVAARTFRAAGPASNADAALAFTVIAQARREEQAEMMALAEEAEEAGRQWFAYAPLSGARFVPRDDGPVRSVDEGPSP